MPLDADSLRSRLQKIMQDLPVFVVGSGLSCAEGLPGMDALAKHLAANVQPDQDERAEWEQVQARVPELGLESALQAVQVRDSLRLRVVHATHQLIIERESAAITRAVKGQVLPLARVLDKCLRTTGRKASVVTTNYDRLVEVAAEQANGVAYTGFTVGGIRNRDDDRCPWRITRGRGKQHVLEPTVDIWKVHGSVDWFRSERGVFATSYIQETAQEYAPVMVAPGNTKYEETHQEPYRSISQLADRAMREAKSFLCLGYGFNDNHVQPTLLERATASLSPAPIVLLTWELTPAARRLLIEDRCPRFVALTAHSDGAMVYTDDAPDGLVIPGPPIWKLADFFTLVWGST